MYLLASFPWVKASCAPPGGRVLGAAVRPSRVLPGKDIAMSAVPQLTPELDQAAETFMRVRRRLFGIAYRILGGTADAEDAVQETWFRWQRCDRAAVRQPDAFLATTVTRVAINMSQSARARRETYVGQWLPEPVSTAGDPTLGADRGEALSLAVLLLLERLSPT